MRGAAPRLAAVTNVLLGGLLWALAMLAGAAPAAIDLHAYWDNRCRDCHGDAGAFARRTLRVEQGRLVGAHHDQPPALQRFLQNHYLSDDLIEPVTAMLTAQVATPALFKAQCGGCHGTAAAFARESLVWRDGVLTGKKSGRPVDAYLRTHGGFAPADVPEMVKTLGRVMGEVGAR